MLNSILSAHVVVTQVAHTPCSETPEKLLAHHESGEFDNDHLDTPGLKVCLVCLSVCILCIVRVLRVCIIV